MAADVQFWDSARQVDGAAKRAPVRHQRCGRHDSALVCIHDGLVNARSQTKIIRIDDQPSQVVSLTAENVLRSVYALSRAEATSSASPA